MVQGQVSAGFQRSICGPSPLQRPPKFIVSTLPFNPATSSGAAPTREGQPASNLSMDIAAAIAAIALPAVAWDGGVLTMAGSRALCHAPDYRKLYHHYGKKAWWP